MKPGVTEPVRSTASSEYKLQPLKRYLNFLWVTSKAVPSVIF